MEGKNSKEGAAEQEMLHYCGHRLVRAVPAANQENIVLCMSSLSEMGYFFSTSRKYIA